MPRDPLLLGEMIEACQRIVSLAARFDPDPTDTDRDRAHQGLRVLAPLIQQLSNPEVRERLERTDTAFTKAKR